MGLDVSHDCFSGGYMGFNVFREQLAKAVGIPLMLMEGFYEPFPVAFIAPFGEEMYSRRVSEWLPIQWSTLKPDPLIVLLDHSDCDGIIEVKDCLPLAERLEELAPSLPGEDSKFRMNFQAVALQFARGLRTAAEANETVEFY